MSIAGVDRAEARVPVVGPRGGLTPVAVRARVVAAVQTLGLSNSTPRSEGWLKSLLWPSIRNETDLDYITRQGFWVCFGVGILSLWSGAVMGQKAGAAIACGFYVLSGMGVREKSRVAAVSAFAVHLLGAMVAQRATGMGFGLVTLIILALLAANMRGIWQSSQWKRDDEIAPPERLNQTLADKLSDQMPAVIWPKIRYLQYVVAAFMILGSLIALLMPPSFG